MKINEIYLKNFRIFDEINVSFKDRNVIIGPNGSGKTTLIEALNYVSVLSPLRTYETDKDLVKVGENYFNILAKFEHDDGVKSTIFVGYEIKDSSTHKKIKLDDKKVNVIDVSGRLKVVPFLIEDYEVVIGAPSWRRKIIDNFLIISNPSYHHNLLNYYKILKQKNMVLKSIDTSDKGINDKSELDEKKELVKVYNTDIAKFAIQITKERYEFFNYILEYMNLHSPIKVDLKYKSQVKIFLEKHQDPVSYYIEFINSEIEKEIAYGKSMIGPHLDDILITSRDRLARSFLSQGQIRLVSIFFKLGCAEYILHKTNVRPILLMDDILGELDEESKNKILEKVLSLPYQIAFSFFEVPHQLSNSDFNFIKLKNTF